MLEIDHIIPKSKCGDDNINNLVTSCFDCNRGKSATPLDRIPNSLVSNLEIIKEKEEQLDSYEQSLLKLKRRVKSKAKKIEKVYISQFPGMKFTPLFKNGSLTRFQYLLPHDDLIEAISIACSKCPDSSDAIKYFCGICWKKIKGKSYG